MSEKYRLADSVKKIAGEIIATNHPHLVEARIVYLFRSGKWETAEKVVLGKAKCTSEDTRFLAEYDFIIIINESAFWAATDEQQQALVDHELSHCDYSEDAKGNRKWRCAHHDVEEFVGVVRRHGLWESDLQKLVKAASEAPNSQVDLFADTNPINSINSINAIDKVEPTDMN